MLSRWIALVLNVVVIVYTCAQRRAHQYGRYEFCEGRHILVVIIIKNSSHFFAHSNEISYSGICIIRHSCVESFSEQVGLGFWNELNFC